MVISSTAAKRMVTRASWVPVRIKTVPVIEEGAPAGRPDSSCWAGKSALCVQLASCYRETVVVQGDDMVFMNWPSDFPGKHDRPEDYFSPKK